MSQPDKPSEGKKAARIRRLLRPPRSRRGFLMLLAMVATIGAAVTAVGLFSMEWSETRSFCSRCHTMRPEVKANKLSPHRDVACGECHVKPGVRGWVASKVNGAKQTFELVTGTYPKPIPSPDHAKLPPAKDTCVRCHSIDDITKDGRPTKFILRSVYRKDRRNTRDMVAVLVRRNSFGQATESRGAHWHIQKRVEFASADEKAQEIDWVRVVGKNGRSKQFIARSKIGFSSDVRQDIARLRRLDTIRGMDCVTCHNRVGHDIPSPDRKVDDAIAAGKISRRLPYIKRTGVSRLNSRYPSIEAADSAIAGIRRMYAARYPLVLRTQRRSVNKAIDELQHIYRLVATPEMKVTAKTYPNNLGHRTSRGCFRCHDGGHFEVVKNRVTKRTIPSTCTTCHTFPQVGSSIPSVPLSGDPSFHDPRESVLFSHAGTLAKLGRQTCSSCHQPVFCAGCHKPGTKPTAGPAHGTRYRSGNRE